MDILQRNLMMQRVTIEAGLESVAQSKAKIGPKLLEGHPIRITTRCDGPTTSDDDGDGDDSVWR